MSATNNFSEQFLEYFPCHYSHHGPFTCQIPQRDRVWTPEMKNVVLHEIDGKNHTMIKIAAYLQVNEQRLKNLKSTIREKGHFRPFVGRPVKLDAIAEHTIVEAVKKGVETLTPLKKNTDFRTVLLKNVQETDKRLGGSGEGCTISRTTTNRFLKRTNIKFQQGQVTSLPRARERKDLRNMISMAAVNYAFALNKPAHLIGNFDATQFRVSICNQQLLATVITEENKENNQPLTNSENSALAQSIKWFMLCNAAGKLARDVFVVADKSMGPEECEIYPIMGLTHTALSGIEGYLAVTASRAANLKFFNWYYENIVLPFVDSSRAYVSLAKRDQSFYLVADGEEIQLRPVDDDKLANKLDEAKIDFVKGPASCTDTVCNACDRSNLFKAAKKVSKSTDIEIAADEEDGSLKDLIYEILTKKHPNIGPSRSNVLSRGLVTVVRSLAHVVTPSIVANGFKRIGMYPLDIRETLANCEKDVLDSLGPNRLNEIIGKIPTLAMHFMNDEEGQLTERDMDLAGIPRFETDDRRSLEKDQRVQSHQRAVVLNATGTRARRKEWNKSHSAKTPSNKQTDQEGKEDGGTTRKRKPNRAKEVIEAEKRAKEEKREEKRAKLNEHKN